MRVAIGSDHAGFELKEAAKAFLAAEGGEVLDVGPAAGIRWTIPTSPKLVGAAGAGHSAERGTSSAAAASARRWPPTGFPGSAPACATTTTRPTRASSTTT